MEQDSDIAAESTVPECEEKEIGISDVPEGDGKVTESSAEHEDKRKEAVSSAMQEDNAIEEEFPAEQVDGMKETVTAAVQEVRNTPEPGSPAEKCNEVESSKKKKKVLRVKRKIVKKSPASRVLKTKKVQGELGGNKSGKDVLVAQEVLKAQQVQGELEINKNEKEVLVAQEVLKTKKEQGEQKDNKKEKEVPAAQEVMEIFEAGNSAEKCSKSESITKKNRDVLKVKKKIVKKSPASSRLLLTDKVQSSPKIQARKKPKNDKIFQDNGKSSEKNSKDTEKQKEDDRKSVSKEKRIEKSEGARTSGKEIRELKNNLHEQNNVEKRGRSDKSTKNQKDKKKDNVGKSQREDKNKENLGGLIFMCSTKTKPDCFHYKVMGVSGGKKDSVLAIKPGLKLFLYDFDLRLLYGIYKASSSGGMKLEPKAFNGAFPAQVRFKIYKDCFPLPENIFKKAINENFYEKHKFRAELTVKQVRKLSDLFRPVGSHLSSATIRPPPRTPVWDRKVRGGDKEVWSRNPKSKDDHKNHQLSHARDREIPYREELPRHREEASRALHLSEKDYRTYGLQTERRDPVPHPALETYHRDFDRDYQLSFQEPRYRDVVPAHREIVRADHVYFDGKDYPVYTIDPRPELSPPKPIAATISDRNAYDPYYSRQYVSPVDPYLIPSRREEALPPIYSGRNYVVDTEPVRHAADALSYYNQTHHKKHETDTMPVSSRYSFAGPSYTYR